MLSTRKVVSFHHCCTRRVNNYNNIIIIIIDNNNNNDIQANMWYAIQSLPVKHTSVSGYYIQGKSHIIKSQKRPKPGMKSPKPGMALQT